MTVVQVLLDLGTLNLKEGDELTAEGIAKSLGEMDKIVEERDKALLLATGYLSVMAGLANDLTSIIDGDFSMMEKANRLRALSHTTTTYVKQQRELNK